MGDVRIGIVWVGHEGELVGWMVAVDQHIGIGRRFGWHGLAY